MKAQLEFPPLTLTLSPEYGREGTRAGLQRTGAALNFAEHLTSVGNQTHSSLRGQPIPNPRLGEQITGTRRVLLQLLTKLVHVNAEVVRFVAGARPPYFLE